jgi:antigen flippase
MSVSVSNTSVAVSTLEPEPLPVPEVGAEKSTYGQILKSTVLVGGSSVLSIAIGIVRSKVMAVLLGPAGVGLIGLYTSISDLAFSVAGMGVNSSGVRQIAEAAGTNEANRIAVTASVLRRTSVILGLLGGGLLIAFSRQVSQASFGSDKHAGAVSLLAIAVMFRLISAGQTALIQGLRRIADLAKMGVFGALFGTLVGVPMVYFFREKGIVPSLVAVAAMTVFTSWWYSRKACVDRPHMTTSQVGQEATALLKLGFAFMATGFMTMGSAYLIRITIVHELGLEAAGMYQSAWALAGMYVGLILQAMGADFYPRLTACANDNGACNRIVNEQARVGLLLAGPGVTATLTFAPLVIALFYSAKFAAAVGILRWICLGTALQVITWPMGFIILAKGKQNLFFWSELAWTVVYIGVAWGCVKHFGMNGAGIAFFASYIFHVLLIYPIVRVLSGFRWSSENQRTGILFLGLIGIVFIGFYVLPFAWAVTLGTLAFLMSSVYSLRRILSLVSLSRIPDPILRVLAGLRLVPSASPSVV